MANVETITNPNSKVRPRQVLLVGLGGIGSRTVDKIMSIMPDEYKKYTNAVAVDTDIEELDKLLYYIPSDNRIALGSNPDSGQSVTVGEYIRNNSSTTDWFVKGDHLETIKNRNTAQGAKQVRMVSRIALAATNDFCGMKKTLSNIIQQFNHDDGTSLNKGLLVMVVCSVAGGTGAGTVLQFPLYLEQALSQLFSDEDVQIECSMLLPSMFARVQDPENQNAARANAYAVIRELMSLNSGKLKRGDMIANADLEVKGENISPYGRVLFFDSTSMSGDTLNGDLDHVYIPKVADALNEYLFGPVSGKITSALDNTLSRVYNTGGAAIFSSVGTAKLEFPRATYTQYAIGNWVTKAVEKDWMEIDKSTNIQFKEELRKAIEDETEKPDDKRKREIYCELIDEKATPFFKEIKSRLKVSENVVSNEVADIVDEFWYRCKSYLVTKVKSDQEMANALKSIHQALDVGDKDSSITALSDYKMFAEKAVRIGYMYEKTVMCPPEAESGVLYKQDRDDVSLFGFIKEKKLHPIIIRYFLYKLSKIVDINCRKKTAIDIKREELEANRGRTFRTEVDDFAVSIKDKAVLDVITNFCEYMKKDLEIYIAEYEDMFKKLGVIVAQFEDKKHLCLDELPLINEESGKVLAGGKLSMMYTWRRIEDEISDCEDAYTIDDELNGKIHEIVYKGFVKQYLDRTNVRVKAGEDEFIKVRTKYERVVGDELQKYYSRKIYKNYTHCFPANVIESALLECGLRNAYKRDAAGVDSTVSFTFEKFLERNPEPYNVAKSDGDFVSDADYLNAVLNSVVGKSRPYCGKIDDNAGNKGIINRLLVINRSMLRTKEDPLNIDEDGIPGVKYIEDEIIDGVSSSRVGGFNVNTKFVSDGISPDTIAAITSVAGLQPSNFVAFLPPDDDEHAPTKEQTYYSAYRAVLDKIATRSDYITPHLHWAWHRAGKLSDVTVEYTNTYNRQAAEAFMLGFIFDLIVVREDAVVEIGKNGIQIFKDAMGGKYTDEFNLLEPETHAIVDSLSGAEKRNIINSVLVKIFELLATSAPIRSAIIAYCEAEMKRFELEGSPEFVKKCMEPENVDSENYDCILDVVAGYYNATRHLTESAVERADFNLECMFNFLLENMYKVAEVIAIKGSSDTKGIYDNFVAALYENAVCDDGAGTVTSTEGEESDLADTRDSATEFKRGGNIDAWLSSLTSSMSHKVKNPFANGRFDLKHALDMLNVFLNK